eukprot:10990481-Alexandrium_andersonii.AAC.1
MLQAPVRAHANPTSNPQRIFNPQRARSAYAPNPHTRPIRKDCSHQGQADTCVRLGGHIAKMCNSEDANYHAG